MRLIRTQSSAILLNLSFGVRTQTLNGTQSSRPNTGGKQSSTYFCQCDKLFVSGYYRDAKNTVVMYINFNERAVDLNFTLSRSPHLRADKNYTVRDLWEHEDKPDVVSDYFFDGNIPPHDVRAYIFKEL